MANEIQYYGNPETQTGLTITANIYNSTGALVDSDRPVPEISGSPAVYIADFPNSLPADNYIIRFWDNGTTFVGQGDLDWDGSKEIITTNLINELHNRFGLDPNDPIVATTSLIASSLITIDITGDSESKTLTRQ